MMLRNLRLLPELLVLLGILLLASYLRLTNVGQTPGWYTDEGTEINIAANLAVGRVQYLAMDDSFLLFGRPPLFSYLLAAIYHNASPDIVTLRTFTGLLGVLSVVLLWWVVRRTKQPVLALVAALMLAIYPNAVIYNRFGFNYNLVTPLLLLTFWGLWEYLESSRRVWLTLATLAIGIGSLANLMILNLLLPLILVVLARRWRDLLWCLPLAVLPIILYIVTFASEPFLFDLSYTLTRLNRLHPLVQVIALVRNFALLLQRDVWFTLALVGFFVLSNLRLRALCLLLLLLPIITLGRTVAFVSLGYYYITPLLPFVALGVGALVRYGFPRVLEFSQSTLEKSIARYHFLSRARRTLAFLGTTAVLFFLFFTPIIGLLWQLSEEINSHLTTQIDFALLNPDDARQVIEYVNAAVESDDVVIASPGLAWAIAASAADFQMSIAYDGVETVHLPGNLPHERFAFDPRYATARYVIIDNLWLNWAVPNVEGVRAIVDDVTANWTLVFEAGEIKVYENPNEG